MKNCILILLCAIIASSCSDKFTLVKRRYNKGYYLAMKHAPLTKQAQLSRRSAHALAPAAQQPAAIVAAPSENTVIYSGSETSAAVAGSSRRIASSRQHMSSKAPAPVPAPESMQFKELKASNLAMRRLAPNNDVDPDVMLVILVVLAILIPPLAVYLKAKAVNKWFLVTLILCLLSLLGAWWFYYVGILWLAAVVIALLYVLDMLS